MAGKPVTQNQSALNNQKQKKTGNRNKWKKKVIRGRTFEGVMQRSLHQRKFPARKSVTSQIFHYLFPNVGENKKKLGLRYIELILHYNWY